MSYHNTTHQAGATLKNYQKKSDKQDERVLEIFKKYKSLTACQCWDIYCREYGQILLTSTRRSITDCKQIIKTNLLVKGVYGRSAHVYRYVGEWKLF